MSTIQAEVQYHDRDVCKMFRGFAAPDRDDEMTTRRILLYTEDSSSPGSVALAVGWLTIEMDAGGARELAAMLAAAADRAIAELKAPADPPGPAPDDAAVHATWSGCGDC